MDQMPSREEFELMSGQNHNPAAHSYGKLQVFDWCPPPQHSLTSRGRNSESHTPAATSVHPLVPLLLYSDSHFPSSSPYSQPIGAAAALQADAHSRTRLRHHGDGVISGGGGGGGRAAVKKPLNAFMLYMKEMRHKVLQEGRERESAAINRILGRRAEQSKYYELAQKERRLHMQLYPGWSARDNYGKRKRKRSQQRAGSSPSWSLSTG